MVNEEAVRLNAESFLEERCPGSRILLVGVAGLQPKKPVPDFHWRGAFAPYQANKLFIRDLCRIYYQRGIPGVGDDAGTAGRYLRDYKERCGFERCLVFGYSSGGHAAILFGRLMGADEVHVFSPRTRVPTRSKARLVRYIPTRRWGLLRANARLHFDPRIDRSYYDLLPLMADDNGRTHTHIYYGTRHAEDVANAGRLDGCPRVTFHEYDTDSHYLVRQLRDSGELATILSLAFERMVSQQT